MSEMQTQFEMSVQNSKEDLAQIKSSIEFLQCKLDKVSEPALQLFSSIKGSHTIQSRYYKLIDSVGKELSENLVSEVIAGLKGCSPEYIEGERADEICAWEEIRYLIHHIDYFYENDFLYSVNKRSVENSYEYLDQNFSDLGADQLRMAEQVFSEIEFQTKKLKPHERAIIWGLNEDYEGMRWLFSEEDEEEELMWDDDFIQNHVYGLLLSKAEETPVTANVENI